VIRGILLDTCALLWIVAEEGLTAKAQESIADLGGSGGSVFVSPITAGRLDF